MEINPVDVTLFEARERAQPFAYSLTSTNIFGLAVEAVQLAKLIATEERDLEAIRSNHELKTQFLTDLHDETMLYLESTYKERSQMIEVINMNAQLLIKSGEFGAAQQIMFRLTDFLSGDSPLKSVTDMRKNR